MWSCCWHPVYVLVAVALVGWSRSLRRGLVPSHGRQADVVAVSLSMACQWWAVSVVIRRAVEVVVLAQGQPKDSAVWRESRVDIEPEIVIEVEQE